MQYMGGKSRIAKRIAPFLIADGIRCHTYLEPFIGGGSVFAEVSPYFDQADYDAEDLFARYFG